MTMSVSESGATNLMASRVWSILWAVERLHEFRVDLVRLGVEFETTTIGKLSFVQEEIRVKLTDLSR